MCTEWNLGKFAESGGIFTILQQQSSQMHHLSEDEWFFDGELLTGSKTFQGSGPPVAPGEIIKDSSFRVELQTCQLSKQTQFWNRFRPLMQPVTHCSSLMEVLLMSCDTEKRCDENKGFSSLWGLVYVRGARETLNSKTSRRRRMKSTYFTLQFISRGKCTGIWRQTKTHQSLAIRWLQDTHTHGHLLGLLIIRVC